LDGAEALQLGLDARVALCDAPDEGERLLDHKGVVRRREQLQQLLHAARLADGVLEVVVVLGELGERHDHDPLQPLPRHLLAAGLEQHLEHLDGDAVLEEVDAVGLAVLRHGGDREACVLFVVGVLGDEQRAKVLEAHLAVRVGAGGVPGFRGYGQGRGLGVGPGLGVGSMVSGKGVRVRASGEGEG
jgi:hypothetical protein